LRENVYIDIEANKLVHPTKIWCIVCTDLDTGEEFKFRPNSPLAGHDDFKDEFIAFAKTVKRWYGHNIIGYDMPNINRLLGTKITVDEVEDTLVLSRLFRPVPAQHEPKGFYNRQWGHSLEAWGRYLRFPKGDWSDWSKFSEPQLEYCVQDNRLGVKILKELNKEREGFSEQSIRLEHYVAYMLWQQVENGFYLDKIKAEQLKADTAYLLEEMNAKLTRLFPPLPRLVRNLVVKTNKDGTVAKVPARILETYQRTPGYSAILKEDGSYDLMVEETFNPQSGDQIAERLLGLGWTPRHFTDKGRVKTDKTTLSEAIYELLTKYPEKTELRCLADYSIVANRHDKANTWLKLSQLEEWCYDGRVHGQINPIGAGTHRCSHYNDNMANIARVVTKKIKKDGLVLSGLNRFDLVSGNDLVYLKEVSDNEIEVAVRGIRGAYGWDSRDCWSVPGNHILVGADAAGIQLRALAHYMDDQEYIKTLISGDIHEFNRKAAEIETRSKAKTWVYSLIMGAGDEKLGTVLITKPSEFDSLFAWAKDQELPYKFKKRFEKAKNYVEYLILKLQAEKRKARPETVATIIKGMKSRALFMKNVPSFANFKNKIIPAAAEEGFMIGLDGRKVWLPNAHLAMSIYLQNFEAVIMKQAMKFYHDDLKKQRVFFKQCSYTHDEYQTETYNEYGDVVGQSMVKGIVDAGLLFNTSCPLDGEYRIGHSWAQTH
jgi:DNA polymerase-1